jgi:putative transposase
MANKKDPSDQFPKDFFKQFKDKETFQNFFNSFFKQGIEEMLKGELDEHPGYSKHSIEGYNSGNSRNGSFPKTITTENVGDVVLSIPRDRLGEFEPQIIPKGETISTKIQDAILGMYSRGMTTSDVRNQVLEIYGLSISETTVSNITERVMESAREWQQHTLEPVYFAVWMDGIVIKIRDDKKVINKCIYIVIGLKPNGLKEVLGFWIEKTESAAFWMSVLTDLKARGVEDILIACTDNLKGFTQAIAAVFPLAVTQLCIVHQIRNSCRFVVLKDRTEFCRDLKTVYTAIYKEIACCLHQPGHLEMPLYDLNTLFYNLLISYFESPPNFSLKILSNLSANDSALSPGTDFIPFNKSVNESSAASYLANCFKNTFSSPVSQ